MAFTPRSDTPLHDHPAEMLGWAYMLDRYIARLVESELPRLDDHTLSLRPGGDERGLTERMLTAVVLSLMQEEVRMVLPSRHASQPHVRDGDDLHEAAAKVLRTINLSCNALARWVHERRRVHAEIFDQSLSDVRRRKAEARYHELTTAARGGSDDPTNPYPGFNAVMDGFLAELEADVEASELRQARLVRQLARRARTHRQWLLGGSGHPRSTEQTAARNGIEDALRRGAVRIGRAFTDAGMDEALDTALAAVRAVSVASAPKVRLVGASHALRDGGSVPSVPRSSPPFNAAVVEAYTEGDADDEVAIESVELSRPDEMASERYLAQGNARVRLQWIVAAPADACTVTLEVRNAAGARRTRFTIPAATPRQ